MVVHPSADPTAASRLPADTTKILDAAATRLNTDRNVLVILEHCANIIEVTFPVRMDNGKIKMFTGYRLQHNNVLGPFKGGLRFHPSVSLEEMKVLASSMTWKAAIARLPYGGGKGGIAIDPASVSRLELERITRRFTFALGDSIGGDYDIPAPDIGTDSQIMAWILDTYLTLRPPHQRLSGLSVVTGKPIELGGSVGRDKATGQGIVYLLERWAKDRHLDLSKLTYTVQGYGKVGAWAARILGPMGAKLLAVEDHTGAIANPAGIDPYDLYVHTKAKHGIAGYPKASAIDHRAFMSTKADIFIPAALANQITAETAPLLNVRVIAEGANAPTTAEGDRILLERKIDVLPDVMCNSGGVIVSYFEWLQNKANEAWDLHEVDTKLKRRMDDAYDRVSKMAADHNVDWRTAAYMTALAHLEKVYTERGIFP